MPPTLTILADLETRELRGVEILAAGTWNGDPYTVSHLTSIQEAFYALKAKLTPPGKLGHDDGQKLAQRDGYPAIGWVSKLYTVGSTLLADFTKVPAKVAALIQAGAYDRISAEVFFDFEIDGKTWPRVLKAVSFLGGDMPAVRDIKSIADVSVLYADLPKSEAHLADMPWDKGSGGDEGDDEKDTAKMIADLDASLAACEASGPSADKPNRKRLNGAISKMRAELAGLKSPPFATNSEGDSMDTKKLAAALGLPETASEDEIMKAAEVKGKAAPPAAELSDATATKLAALNDQLGAVTRELALTKATTAVTDALKDGKIAPAQTEWAKTYAVENPEGFAAYVKGAPRLAVLSAPLGSDGRETPVGDDAKPSDAAKVLAGRFGVTDASLERAASGRPTRELVAEARAKRVS